MRQLKFTPQLGPWFMTYGHDEFGTDATGVMVSGGSNEITVSASRKGHPGAIVGVRWRRPRAHDRQFTWQWPRGTEAP
jgi:hypothetical protein